MAFTLADSLAKLRGQQQAWDTAMHPGTVQIATTSYACALLINSAPPELELAGIHSRDVLTVWVSKTLLSTAPAIGTTVAAQSRQWVVQNISGSESHSHEWRITCIE
jgi:hypothetical protein